MVELEQYIVDILYQYGIYNSKQHNYNMCSLSSGLIHNTWKIEISNHNNIQNDTNSMKYSYILQQFNIDIFKNPYQISENIENICFYLHEKYPSYKCIQPVKMVNGNYFCIHNAINKNINSESNSKNNSNSDYVEPESMTTATPSIIPIPVYYRMFVFIENSYVYQSVNSIQLAFEASTHFARFTKLLSCSENSNSNRDRNMDRNSGKDSASSSLMHRLHVTLPDFHNLTMRYAYFQSTIHTNTTGTTGTTDAIDSVSDNDTASNSNSNNSNNGINIVRLHESVVQAYIAYLISLKESIVDRYTDIATKHTEYKLRVTHHDTKISNILFDINDSGLCVIDLDTVMPGYFISDIGDMIRTYACIYDENESDFDLICVRNEYILAIVEGYIIEIGFDLTASELNCFIYAGKYMIYMQALRFLCDYIRNDIYYTIQYNTQNIIRAGNQIKLLRSLIEQEVELDIEIMKIIKKYL
mgnify:FL=1